MPDSLITTIDAAAITASPATDVAEILWRTARDAHAAFNARARETEYSDPLWDGPEFNVLTEAVSRAERALMDLRTTTPLGILRKLELLFESANWHLKDLDEEERRIIGGIITDLRRQLGHPANGTDDINVNRE